ncbi:MAG: D-glycero-beta-D-manno-heptose-7-phosphate kinase [Candidatus Methylomirabilales bacterium]
MSKSGSHKGVRQTRSRLHEILGRLRGRRVLVVGDVMMDEYIWGSVSRISPEAPVPVVEVHAESTRLGGAANVAANICSLGGEAELVGIVGGDAPGERLVHDLETMGGKSGGIVVDRDRPTTIKTRVVAGSQHIVRFDRESVEEMSPAVGEALVGNILDRLAEVDALLLSDYGKGIITASLLARVLPAARAAGRIITVDPKVNHFNLYHGLHVLTPNHLEAAAAWGRPIRKEEDVAAAGQALCERLGVEGLLITRGERGMCLCERGGRVTHIPVVAKEVYDVTGAGDTVIGTLTLALAAGASLYEGAVIANRAAGVVVGKVGTATVRPTELAEVLAAGER